jgi:hypothetical protein
MCKKLLIAALAVVVGVGLVSGTRLGSHIRMAWHKAAVAVQEQIPLDSEIERLKFEVANLAQEDNRYFDQVARQKHQVAKLRKSVSQKRTDLAAREAEIKELNLALAEGHEFVAFRGERWDRKKAQSDFFAAGARFLDEEKVVKAEEENLKILEETLATNKAKLDSLALRRKKMEADLLVLESELAKQRLKDQSQMVIDEGRYGRVSQEINELKDRFDVQKTKSELKGEAGRGSIFAQSEKKAEEQKLEKVIKERFGPTEPLNKVQD